MEKRMINVLDLDFQGLSNCEKSKTPDNPLVIPVYRDGKIIPGYSFPCEEYREKGLMGTARRQCRECRIFRRRDGFYCGEITCESNLGI
jgi:hypothetical protein